ncbi:hypothetical protein K431DRAFT_293854 [Polychaeton citri CBS 116435]|uniref:Uncharacterized protein n=1 Tax=Polychaeton citri CBS 116435 TaxID=1314669 RepID=A0A9P4Q7C7_9PEZI|nr:hypothetical protein K431DRAFT_293854 [Polychaeton citri CBS 116435]
MTVMIRKCPSNPTSVSRQMRGESISQARLSSQAALLILAPSSAGALSANHVDPTRWRQMITQQHWACSSETPRRLHPALPKISCVSAVSDPTTAVAFVGAGAAAGAAASDRPDLVAFALAAATTPRWNHGLCGWRWRAREEFSLSLSRPPPLPILRKRSSLEGNPCLWLARHSYAASRELYQSSAPSTRLARSRYCILPMQLALLATLLLPSLRLLMLHASRS